MTRAVNTALAGSGGVLQVVQTIKTDTFSSTALSWTSVTGLSVSITPISTASKILVLVDLQAVGATSTGCTMRITRNGTAIGIATSAGNRNAGSGPELYSTRTDQFYSNVANVLDSPASVASLTYAVQMIVGGSSGTVYVNRSVSDFDTTSYTRSASAITVMEIAG